MKDFARLLYWDVMFVGALARCLFFAISARVSCVARRVSCGVWSLRVGVLASGWSVCRVSCIARRVWALRRWRVGPWARWVSAFFQFSPSPAPLPPALFFQFSFGLPFLGALLFSFAFFLFMRDCFTSFFLSFQLSLFWVVCLFWRVVALRFFPLRVFFRAPRVTFAFFISPGQFCIFSNMWRGKDSLHPNFSRSKTICHLRKITMFQPPPAKGAHSGKHSQNPNRRQPAAGAERPPCLLCTSTIGGMLVCVF